MILGSEAIRRRLEAGQVFREGTWCEKSIKEASYALRVASDGLMLAGRHYRPEEEHVEGEIVVEPGEIAILSTLEQLNMPDDLAGKIGIRFDLASQGLTGLMGIQVDPLFGQNVDKERLYIRVANLANDPISIPVCAEAFTLELHEVAGKVSGPSEPRHGVWYRLLNVVAGQQNPGRSHITGVQLDLSKKAKQLDERLESETENIRNYLQPVVMFGIFLVAVTILGVSLTVILSVRETPAVTVPSWVTGWGWAVLLFALSAAAVATAAMGVCMVRSLWAGSRGSGRRGRDASPVV